MRVRAILDQADIEIAVKEFVEKRTGGYVRPGVPIRIVPHVFPGTDPREKNHVTAEVDYEAPDVE